MGVSVEKMLGVEGWKLGRVELGEVEGWKGGSWGGGEFLQIIWGTDGRNLYGTGDQRFPMLQGVLCISVARICLENRFPSWKTK